MEWDSIKRFRDRSDAGKQLAAALARYKRERPVVLALPRGGVPVAAEVAAALVAPLDLILVRKIGVPFQPELAMGAVADGPEPTIVRNEDVIQLAEITEAQFKDACERELAEIERRRRRYLTNRPRANVEGRVVIIVDDGIATGATTRVALRATRMRKPSKIVLATPVAPTDTLRDLRAETDGTVCLEQHETLGAIGLFYADFRQITDDEVVAILARFPTPLSAPAEQPHA